MATRLSREAVERDAGPGDRPRAQAIHADVRTSWAVAELASIADMSRSAFSAWFGEVLGCAPIDYLVHWRMVIAKVALARGNKTVERIAEEIS